MIINPYIIAPASSFVNDKSLLFDGVDEYVTIGTLAALDSDVSVSLWVKYASAPASDEGLFNRFASSTSRFQIYVNTSGGITTRIAATTRTSAGLSVGWNHVVVVNDSTTEGGKMYLNGTQFGTDSYRSNTGSGNVYFGSLELANYFSGNIDEVAVFNYGLSSTQVTSLYNSGAATDLDNTSGVTAPIHWWRMGDGDTFPTITDVGTTGGKDGTMTNMESGDIVNDAP